MRVAIIGAGPAGLACAFELKKHGIVPTVFEKRSPLGRVMDFPICTLRLFDTNVVNPLNIFEKKYRLRLHPLYLIKEVTMLSPSKRKVITGSKLGHVFKLGNESYSIESQLIKSGNIQVEYNSPVNLEDINGQYDYIVAATGDDSIAKNLNLWTTLFNSQVRIATVIGKFKTGSVKIWFNNRYAKQCFGYFVPNNEREACLFLIANDATSREMDYLWKEFLITESLPCDISETREFEYNIGQLTAVQKDNIYFIGNAAGFCDDLLGFGMMRSIESGILAARSIVKNLHYSELVRPIMKDLEAIHQYRRAVNQFNNADFDRMVTFLGSTGVKHLIYRNPLFKAVQGAPLVKLYNKFKRH